ncbi:MAG: hypothetical protein KC964_13150, partial [Candidatus Omnitrophica bacterium]|nr:hypothetical protein [Candidatus Omnitrophota bacterium]
SPGYQPALYTFAEKMAQTKESPEEALALALQCVKSFPRSFRAWWALSYSAGQISDQFQYNISEESLDEEMFPFFQILASINGLGMEKTIAINPTSADVWKAKMYQASGGFGWGEQYMEAFRKAVQYGPDDPGPYEILHYHMRGMMSFPPYHLEALQSALEKIPNRVNAYLGLFETLAYGSHQGERLENLPPEYIQTLSRAAEIIVNEKRIDKHLLKALEIDTLSGNQEAARELLKRRVEQEEANQGKHSIPWSLIEDAVFFGSPDLAMELLELYGDPKKLLKLNPEDAFESTRDLVIGKTGRWEEAKSRLKERILDAEDNLFSMLRYMELGLETDLDPEVKKVCVEYLIDYAPPPMEYGGNRDMGIPGDLGSMAPAYYQDFLRAMAEGHLASVEGDHEKAVESYTHASQAAQYLRFKEQASMPEVLPHLVRERSRM